MRITPKAITPTVETSYLLKPGLWPASREVTGVAVASDPSFWLDPPPQLLPDSAWHRETGEPHHSPRFS